MHQERIEGIIRKNNYNTWYLDMTNILKLKKNNNNLQMRLFGKEGVFCSFFKLYYVSVIFMVHQKLKVLLLKWVFS